MSLFCNKKEVSLLIRLVSIKAVSEIFSFKLIRLDKVAVSARCNNKLVSVIFNLASNAVCVKVEIGLFKSEVLSALDNPTMDFEIPTTVPVNVGDSIGAFKSIRSDKLIVSRFCNNATVSDIFSLVPAL